MPSLLGAPARRFASVTRPVGHTPFFDYAPIRQTVRDRGVMVSNPGTEKSSDWPAFDQPSGAIRTHISCKSPSVCGVVPIEIRSEQAGDEQDLLNRLRETGALALSLVAMDGDRLVGQITLSPATPSDGSGPWFALGPVSVAPACQSQGIGSQLIRAGLDEISAQGALGCVLTGNPAYSERCGFELAPNNVPKQESPEFFQLKLQKAAKAEGCFAFHSAFYESYGG